MCGNDRCLNIFSLLFLAFVKDSVADGPKLTTQTKMTDFLLLCGYRLFQCFCTLWWDILYIQIIFHLPIPMSLYSFLVKLKLNWLLVNYFSVKMNLSKYIAFHKTCVCTFLELVGLKQITSSIKRILAGPSLSPQESFNNIHFTILVQNSIAVKKPLEIFYRNLVYFF